MATCTIETTDVLSTVLGFHSLERIVQLKSVSRAFHSCGDRALFQLRRVRSIPEHTRKRVLHVLVTRCPNLSEIHCATRVTDQKDEKSGHNGDYTAFSDRKDKHDLAKILKRSKRLESVRRLPPGVIQNVETSLPALTSLDTCISVPEDVLSIAQLCQNLRSLTLVSTRATYISIQPVLENLCHLKILTIFHLTPSTAALPFLTNLKDLEELCFFDAFLTNIECRNVKRWAFIPTFHLTPSTAALPFLSNLRDLEELCFFDAFLTNIECRVIGEHAPRMLKHLIVSGPGITGEGIRSLARNLKHVVDLDIAETDVGPDVCEFLAMPNVFPRLKRLVVHPSVEVWT